MESSSPILVAQWEMKWDSCRGCLWERSSEGGIPLVLLDVSRLCSPRAAFCCREC